MDMEAEQIIAQVDLSALAGQLLGLAQDRAELSTAAAKASKATKAVGFLDRINVFTKSEAELERDATKAARGSLEEAVVAKEAQVRSAIWSALPASAKLRCLIGDLQRAHTSFRTHTDQVRGAFDEYHTEVVRRAKDVDEYIRDLGDAAKGAKKPRDMRRTKVDPDDIEDGIADTVAACDDADRVLRNLSALLSEETGNPMTGLNLDDLLEAALTRAAMAN